MTANEFAYWLQGFAELSDDAPTKAQWKAIREHLQLVFTKVTPQVSLAPSSAGYLLDIEKQQRAVSIWPTRTTC